MGFAVALVFLLVTGLSAWRSEQRNLEAFRAVEHTHEVIDQADATLVGILNLAVVSRGFAISGNEARLQSYQAGTAATQQSFDALRQLTQDNLNQQRRLVALEPLIQERMSFAAEVIKMRRLGDTAKTLELIASGRADQVMDEIRLLMAEIREEEESLLQERTTMAQATDRSTQAIVAFGSLLALGLVGLASVIVRRDFAKRQEAEAERDRFFNLSIDVFGIAHRDGYFHRVNPAFAATLGWTADEILARPFMELVHADDHAATLAQVEKLGRGEPTIHFENRCGCRDGSWKTLAWHAVSQPDGTIYCTARDMTEIKLAQEALRRSEQNLAVTLHSIGDAVLATDTLGRITRLNPVAEKLMGWTQAEAQGRPVAEVFCIINEETRTAAVIPVAKVLATGEIHGLANHTIIIARDGAERPIADSAAPIRDNDGAIIGVVLVFRDVTDEKRAEKAVRESERRLSALNQELERRVVERTSEIRQALATLDASDDGAFIFDPVTLRFSYVNEGASRQLGYTRAELLTMTPLDIKPRFDEGKFRELLAPMLRGEVRSRRLVTQYRHKDGHELSVEITLQYIAPAGEPPRFINLVRDITERLKGERLALRSQRLESIGTLAGGVAHDLNNAIAPIMMGLQLIKSQYPQESKILEMFETSAQRSADMVRQLLTFAKGAEGERVLIQPSHLVLELENLIRGSFPKNIQVVIKRAPSLPVVRGDSTQMHQVLLNLCVNARDAMPHGGTLTLEAQRVEVDADYASSVPDAKPGEYVLLRVRDTGTGIPPEIIDRIFEPFFTTKGPDKGTGLGLSTVMGIIKGHDGFLQVYSPPGQGSTFSAYFPAEKAPLGTEDVTPMSAEFHGQGEMILFVDDEAPLRTIARAVLRQLDYTPLVATDGTDGLIQAAQHSIELRAIITDLHMPHMDGLAFVRAIRRMLPSIPIAVASGRMEDAMVEEFKALGVSCRLDKPFTQAQLAEALKNLLTPQ